MELDSVAVRSRRLVGIYDGATVTHEQGRVVLSLWVRTGKTREMVTFVLSPNAYADLQYVMDRGPLIGKTTHRSLEQKRERSNEVGVVRG